MDREDNIYRKSLSAQDLAGLAELCGNVAHNRSADHKQSETAHALRVEWVRLVLKGSPHNGNAEAEAEFESLKKRMTEFLAGLPSWMMSGV